MKNVLFTGVTVYDFIAAPPDHLQKKLTALGSQIRAYLLSRGRPFHKRIWGVDYYLLPSLFFWPLAFCLAFWICKKKKIDTIIAQSPLVEGFLGVLLKKTLGRELIVEVHGDWKEAPFLNKKRKLAFLKKKIAPFLAKMSLRSADKVRAISTYTKEQALSVSGKKPYFVFPTFTDVDSFLQEKDIHYENFILFVGALEKVKGIKYLFEAFSSAREQFPDFKLVLVGEGSEKEKYSSFEGAEFKGKLSLEETRKVMKDCYCLVLPSMSEGLGRVLIEAEALSKPVVASRVGGIPDLVEDSKNGFLAEPGNSEDLAEKIKALLKDRDSAIRMGKNGRELVKEKFSNDKYIENYLKMINA